MVKKNSLLSQDHFVCRVEDTVLITQVVKLMKWFSILYD